MPGLAIWGVLINLAGSICTAIGWCMQKHGHKDAIASDTNYLKNWNWWFGLILVLISQPLYIVSQSMANQSTLGVVGPFSIIINIIFGRLFLDEIVTRWEYFCILLFVPGAILTLNFASKNNDLMNREEFNKTFYDPISLTYLGGHVLVLVILSYISHKILQENAHEKPRENFHENSEETTALLDKKEVERDPESSDELPEPNSENIMRRRCKKSSESTTSQEQSDMSMKKDSQKQGKKKYA